MQRGELITYRKDVFWSGHTIAPFLFERAPSFRASLFSTLQMTPDGRHLPYRLEVAYPYITGLSQTKFKLKKREALR